VRLFGRRDELAGQEVGGGNRIPHHVTGDGHDNSAPDEGPVFRFLLVSISPALRFIFSQTEIEEEDAERVGHIADAGRPMQWARRYGLMIPFRIAYFTNSVRERKLSLRMMFSRWRATVLWLMESTSAIS